MGYKFGSVGRSPGPYSIRLRRPLCGASHGVVTAADQSRRVRPRKRDRCTYCDGSVQYTYQTCPHSRLTQRCQCPQSRNSHRPGATVLPSHLRRPRVCEGVAFRTVIYEWRGGEASGRCVWYLIVTPQAMGPITISHTSHFTIASRPFTALAHGAALTHKGGASIDRDMFATNHMQRKRFEHSPGCTGSQTQRNHPQSCANRRAACAAARGPRTVAGLRPARAATTEQRIDEAATVCDGGDGAGTGGDHAQLGGQARDVIEAESSRGR
jgi:hypothetical protein